MTFEESAVRRGIQLIPWERAELVAALFGVKPTSQFRLLRGQVHGLIEVGDTIRLVAIHNEESGNGEFKQVLEDLEWAADDAGKEFQVVQLWNRRLSEWLRRRGYEVRRNKELGLHAVRPMQVPAITP